MTKRALQSLTFSTATEVAKRGITCNLIAPGAVAASATGALPVRQSLIQIDGEPFRVIEQGAGPAGGKRGIARPQITVHQHRQHLVTLLVATAVLAEGAGELANGFISVGGASTAELASDQMKEFVDRYTKMFGEYNDESNTKVYALEYILATMAANPAAMNDIEAFKTTMDTFEAPNPYMVGDAKLNARLGYNYTSEFEMFPNTLTAPFSKEGRGDARATVADRDPYACATALGVQQDLGAGR